jgi:hypothetical protein
MTDFIAAILEIEKQYGPLSLLHTSCGMSILNAIKKGLKLNTAIIIGSGNIVQNIIEDFIAKLQLKPSLATDLRLHFEKKYGEK